MCGRYVIKLLKQLDSAFEIERGSWEVADNFRVRPTSQQARQSAQGAE
jgi:hypothetical protein